MQKIGVKYHIGQNLDVLDTVHKWTNGEVLYVDEHQIYVHYSGWSAKYDQYIEINSPRILTQWQHDAPIQINNRVDCFHPAGGWLEARVIEIQQKTDRVKVHFTDYHVKYDRWVNLSDRNEVALIGERTKAFGIGNIRGKSNRKKISQQAIKALKEKIAKFVSALESRKWVMKTIKGDGNCLFRSVSHQLYGDQGYHQQIRHLCMKYIEAEKDFFQDFVAEDIQNYLFRKRQDGEWGDDVQIQAISQIYNCPIEIYAFGDKPIKTFHEENSTNATPLRLAYVGSCHYNSIKQQQNMMQGIIPTNFGVFQQNFEGCLNNLKQNNRVNRVNFANSNRVQDTIQQRVEAEMRDDKKVEDDITRVLEMSETQAILDQIEKAEIKELFNKSQQEKIQEELRKMEEKQVEQAKQESKKSQIPRPYWFNDLRNQGFSDKQIEFAIQINGYDPDAVHNFLLDNMCL